MATPEITTTLAKSLVSTGRLFQVWTADQGLIFARGKSQAGVANRVRQLGLEVIRVGSIQQHAITFTLANTDHTLNWQWFAQNFQVGWVIDATTPTPTIRRLADGWK